MWELLNSRKLRPEVVRGPFKQKGAWATWRRQQREQQKLNRLRLAKQHHAFFLNFALRYDTSFLLRSMGLVITETFSFSFFEHRYSPLESIFRNIRHIIQKNILTQNLGWMKQFLIILSIDSRGLLHVLSGSPEVYFCKIYWILEYSNLLVRMLINIFFCTSLTSYASCKIWQCV